MKRLMATVLCVMALIGAAGGCLEDNRLRVCRVTAEGSAGDRRAEYSDLRFEVGDRYRISGDCYPGDVEV